MRHKSKRRVKVLHYGLIKKEIEKNKLEIRDRCIKVAKIALIFCAVFAALGYVFMHSENTGFRKRAENIALSFLFFTIAALAFFAGIAYAIEAYVHGKEGEPVVPPLYPLMLGMKMDQLEQNQEKKQTENKDETPQPTARKRKTLRKIEQKLEKIRQWPENSTISDIFEEKERSYEPQNDNNNNM